MAANSADGAIARQWEILKLMPSPKSEGYKPSNFVEELDGSGFKVSLRTVQRDLKALAEIFDIEGEEREDGTSWRWQAHAKLDIQSLDLTDAVTLRLIESSLRPLLPAGVIKALEPKFANAAEKLAAVSPRNHNATWANKVASVLPMVPFVAPEIDQHVLEAVQECLLKDFALRCQYRAVSAEKPKELTLHPLGLVQRGPVTYLVATVFNYPDPRPFAIHRMSKVENLYEAVKRPKGFTLKQFIDDGGLGFGAAEPIAMVLRVAPPLARALEETRLSTNQRITPDGEWYRLEATVLQTWELEWWLLGKAGDVVVLEPTALRDKLRTRIRSAAEHYSD